jgi:hypothetical protein
VHTCPAAPRAARIATWIAVAGVAVMGVYIKGVGPQWQVLEEAEPLVRGEDEGAAPPVGRAALASPTASPSARPGRRASASPVP